MALVTAKVSDVTPGSLTVTDTCIMYHLTNFDAVSKRYPSYAFRKHLCGSAGFGGGVGKQ
jgi:hypothetical protein